MVFVCRRCSGVFLGALPNTFRFFGVGFGSGPRFPHSVRVVPYPVWTELVFFRGKILSALEMRPRGILTRNIAHVRLVSNRFDVAVLV